MGKCEKTRIDCCNNQPSKDIKLSANPRIAYHLAGPFAITNCGLAVKKRGMVPGDARCWMPVTGQQGDFKAVYGSRDRISHTGTRWHKMPQNVRIVC